MKVYIDRHMASIRADINKLEVRVTTVKADIDDEARQGSLPGSRGALQPLQWACKAARKLVGAGCRLSNFAQTVVFMLNSLMTQCLGSCISSGLR